MNRKKVILNFLATGVILLLMGASIPADFLTQLQNKLSGYQEKYPITKINLAFNQPEYAPGDTLFFSAWYLYEDLTVVKGNHIISVDWMVMA